MKADLHIHTYYSHDSINTFSDIENMAIRRGIDCIAITDHERIDGALKALKNIYRVKVIPGVEYYTEYGHILALNIENMVKADNTPELIEKIRDNNGLSILAHPLDSRKSGEKDFKEILGLVDAVEVANAHDPKVNINYIILIKMAEDLNLGITAGSDSHIPDTIGYAYIESEGEEIVELIENIMERKVRIRFRKVNSRQRVKKILSEALHKAKLYRPSPP